MKKQLWWIVVVPLLAFCGGAAWLFWARSGPTVQGPSQDPIVLLNREHDAIRENAADYYHRAYESLGEGRDRFWDALHAFGYDVPLTADLTEWLENSAKCVENVRDGTRCADFRPVLRRSAGDQVLLPQVAEMKILVQFFHLRARVSAERRDLARFVDDLHTVDAVARHVFEHPLLISDLVGIGCLWRTQCLVTLPYAWSEFSPADGEAYVRSIASLFEPPPSLEGALQDEFNEDCWLYKTQRPSSLYSSLVFPSERVFGELDEALQPLREHLALSIEEQMRRVDQLQKTLEAGWGVRRKKPVAEVGRLLTSIVTVSWPSAIAQRGWLIALQRGNRTVMAILAEADAQGAFPECLDRSLGDFVIDPFTGEPFIYRVTESGFTLYSAGHDAGDDGGMHHPRFGEQHATTGEALPPDGDYVFWPLPERQDGR